MHLTRAHGRHPSLLGVAALAVGVTLLLTGCAPADNGVADRSAEEILAAARRALKTAPSVEYGGRRTEGEVHSSLSITVVGGNADGAFRKWTQEGAPSAGGPGPATTGEHDEGGYRFRKLGDDLFVTGGSPGLYSLFGGNVANVAGGRWIRVPSTEEAFDRIVAMTDLGKLADEMLSPDGTVTKGKRIDQDSPWPAIVIRNGEKVVHVATTGSPCPLRVEGPTSLPVDAIGLDYDKRKVEAPKDTVELSDLQ